MDELFGTKSSRRTLHNKTSTAHCDPIMVEVLFGLILIF